MSCQQVCLMVLCGLPASGKTSLIQEVVSLAKDEERTTFLTVEYDKILPQETESELISCDNGVDSPWKKYRAEIVQCVDQLLQTILTKLPRERTIDFGHSTNIPGVRPELWEEFKHLIQMQISHLQVEGMTDRWCIIIDDNMYYRGMRYSYYQMARKYTVSFCQVYLKISKTTASIGNEGRRVKVTGDVIDAMATKIEPPDPSKNNWEKFSLVLEEDSRDINAVLELMERSFREPVQPIQEVDEEVQNQSRIVCSENVLHQADQILRKIVSLQMSDSKDLNLSKAEMKDLASKCQARRKQLMEALQNGDIQVPPEVISTITDSSKDPDSGLFTFLRSVFKT